MSAPSGRMTKPSCVPRCVPAELVHHSPGEFTVARSPG